MTRRLFALLVASAIAGLAACSVVQESRIGIDAPPGSDAEFGPVSDMLDHRCGTLDCHGQMSRNFRVWGCDGMRLEDGSTPASCSAEKTTPDEHAATYRSLVGLEPTVMTTVYAGCETNTAPAPYPPPASCNPELLTFVRKARGIEAHKGGQLFYPDGIDGGPDPQDVCVVSWLEGQTDRQQCGKALGIPAFPVPDAGTE